MCDLSSREAKTFRITSVINFKDGRKPMKVKGLVSGMCKEHALEKTRSTMHQIGRITDGAKNFKIVKVKNLKTDWIIVPKDDANYNSLEDFLQNKSKHEVSHDDFGDSIKHSLIEMLKQKGEVEGNPIAVGFAKFLEQKMKESNQEQPESVLERISKFGQKLRDMKEEREKQDYADGVAKAKEHNAEANINMNDAPDGVQAEEVETKIGE